MADLNREALEVWNSLKPMIDKEITDKTQGAVQRRKAKVTTAPSLVTNTIGVTEAFGQEIFLPFVTNIASAVVGDLVWIEWMYGASNAFVSSFAEVDKKDFTVAGTFDVLSRRCYATLPTTGNGAGWYRVMSFTGWDSNAPKWTVSCAIDFTITRTWGSANNEVHKVSLIAACNNVSFANETSKSNTMLIDKIRYVIDGNNGYVDIRYNSTSTNPCVVDFAVHTSPTIQFRFAAVTPTKVADSPVSPASVEAEYTFAANAPMGDVSSLVTWDTTYVSSWSGMKVYRGVGCLIFSGKLVFKTGVTLQSNIIGTIDSSIACVAGSPIPCHYSPDPASVVNKPLDVFVQNGTQIRCANNFNNTNTNLGGTPTSTNIASFSGVVPLA